MSGGIIALAYAGYKIFVVLLHEHSYNISDINSNSIKNSKSLLQKQTISVDWYNAQFFCSNFGYFI